MAEADSSLEQSVSTVGEHWRDSPYYADAEQWTHIFWGDQTHFRRLFNQLDLSDVVELACGHGRHAEKMAPFARQLSLMDLHDNNIDICRKRLAGHPNVNFYANNGYDFQPIADNSLTAIFCYDAMVHFSPDIVASYLADATRVLRQGGMALLHHSNYPAPPENHYGQNPHARNHMTLELFQQLTKDAGLAIVETIPLQWGLVPDLDRLSLVRKA
ncbi:class I SAM-dependent methyltransferase [Aminobacter sp. HY435]|uniref:class I SAM-dependent methyltransferase n=1 Tax=Aminobacter sp. HY435 TaxID=2970917 RepID=UPI0022B98D9A|nr:class I SAM-dependent methyltransferase [Aminobacter sp. HY435]